MIAEKLNTRAELIRIHGTAGKFMAACSFYIAQTSARGWFGSGAANGILSRLSGWF
ncbi:hypothetical protein [Desulfovibrio sp. QI0434]